MRGTNAKFKKFVQIVQHVMHHERTPINETCQYLSSNSISAHSAACIYADKSQKNVQSNKHPSNQCRRTVILWSIAQQNRFKPDFLNWRYHSKNVKKIPRKLQKHAPLFKIKRHTQNIMCLQDIPQTMIGRYAENPRFSYRDGMVFASM